MVFGRRKSNEGIGVDMTPMIDVTFQLIIFFMLLMDMSTKELEAVILPKADAAVHDLQDPQRPVINLPPDGRVVVRGEVLFDPARDDGYAALRAWLQRCARRMPKVHLEPDDPSSPLVPDVAVLLRADQSTPFRCLTDVMALCGLEDIRIRKVEFAAGEADPEPTRSDSENGREP